MHNILCVCLQGSSPKDTAAQELKLYIDSLTENIGHCTETQWHYCFLNLLSNFYILDKMQM